MVGLRHPDNRMDDLPEKLRAVSRAYRHLHNVDIFGLLGLDPSQRYPLTTFRIMLRRASLHLHPDRSTPEQEALIRRTGLDQTLLNALREFIDGDPNGPSGGATVPPDDDRLDAIYANSPSIGYRNLWNPHAEYRSVEATRPVPANGIPETIKRTGVHWTPPAATRNQRTTAPRPNPSYGSATNPVAVDDDDDNAPDPNADYVPDPTDGASGGSSSSSNPSSSNQSNTTDGSNPFAQFPQASPQRPRNTFTPRTPQAPRTGPSFNQPQSTPRTGPSFNQPRSAPRTGPSPSQPQSTPRDGRGHAAQPPRPLYPRFGNRLEGISNLTGLAQNLNGAIIGLLPRVDQTTSRYTGEPRYIVEASLDRTDRLNLRVRNVDLSGQALIGWGTRGTSVSYREILNSGRLTGRFRRHPSDQFVRDFLRAHASRQGRINQSRPGDDTSDDDSTTGQTGTKRKRTNGTSDPPPTQPKRRRDDDNDGSGTGGATTARTGGGMPMGYGPEDIA